MKANYRSFDMRFNTFTAVDLGNPSTNSMDLGFLKLAICASLASFCPIPLAFRTLHPELPIKKSEI